MSGQRWAVVLFCLLLTACAGGPQQAERGLQSPTAVTVQQPTPAQPFERQGRFAVHAEAHDQNPDAVQGAFQWYDDGTQLVLELRNPLGQVMGKLQVSEQGAWLQDNRAGMRFAQSADELAQEIFAQPIPVEGLRDWLRGAVSGQAQGLSYAGNQLVQARDQGWRLSLSDYDAHGPTRLLLVFQQGTQRITVRIVIDEGAA